MYGNVDNVRPGFSTLSPCAGDTSNGGETASVSDARRVTFAVADGGNGPEKDSLVESLRSEIGNDPIGSFSQLQSVSSLTEQSTGGSLGAEGVSVPTGPIGVSGPTGPTTGGNESADGVLVLTGVRTNYWW